MATIAATMARFSENNFTVITVCAFMSTTMAATTPTPTMSAIGVTQNFIFLFWGLVMDVLVHGVYVMMMLDLQRYMDDHFLMFTTTTSTSGDNHCQGGN
jgi:hypothetical protein